MSAHDVPSPLYPELHAQLCRPSPSLLHTALLSHVFVESSVHGSDRAHVVPSKTYPTLQAQSYESAPVSLHVPAHTPSDDNLQTSRRSPLAGVSLEFALFDTKLPVGLFAKQPAYHPFPQPRTWSHSHPRSISEAAAWHWPGSENRSYPVGQAAVLLSPSM